MSRNPNHVCEQPLPFQRPLQPAPGQFIVLVRTDRRPDGSQGQYEVSNQTFPRVEDAIEYCKQVSSSRDPVIACLLGGLSRVQ